jgi:predicted esterase
VSLVIGEAIPGPHDGARIVTAGRVPGEARAAIVLCHGRGGSAEDMLALSSELDAAGVAWIAPQANGSTWYPYSFLAPLRNNEPHLSSALALLGAIVQALAVADVPPERQLLIGFSQGGCLALEFAGRSARRYGGVVGLSAGLIGPPGRQWNFSGSLDRTPVFLGCSDRDPHIPEDRVAESGRELARIGGDVDVEIYPGLGHTVNRDELDRVQRILDRIGAA